MSLFLLTSLQRLAPVLLSILATGAAAQEPAKLLDLYGDPFPPGALLRLGTVRFRNRSSIGQIAYSPDGKFLAAGGYGGNVCLFDAATGRQLRELDAFGSQFLALRSLPEAPIIPSHFGT